MNLLTKKSFRIVHVEDDNDFAEVAAIFLNFAGFTQPVVRFDRGPAAIEYLSKIEPQFAPHVILLDLNMPGMNGVEVVSWLREFYYDANVPVCVLSSSDEPADIQLAESAGATKYFLKTSLYCAVAEYLDPRIEINNHQCIEAMVKLGSFLSELALMSEFADEVVILTDPEGLIVWVNESFVKMCGYTLEEVRSKKPGSLLQGPETNPTTVESLHNAVQSATPCECEIINYRKNGEAYPVLISMSPLLNNGSMEGFLAVERELSCAA